MAAADGGRFARAAAAFKEELQRGGDGGENSTLEVSGSVLAKAWAVAHRGLNGATKTAKVFDAIKAGDMAEVELYVCVGTERLHGLPLSMPPTTTAWRWYSCLSRLDTTKTR